MTTYAPKNKNTEKGGAESNAARVRFGASPVVTGPLYNVTIQRKASCACGGGCPVCQAKHSDLSISEPGDEYEKEADLVADRIMRMPAGGASEDENADGENAADESAADEIRPFKSDSPATVQRKASCAAKATEAGAPLVREVLRGGGQPLDRETRRFMEHRMGRDFGHIRIHTDDRAAESAAAIKALAYTSSHHIVFNQGEYRPQTESGKRLLAHELAHTVQQQADARLLMRSPDRLAGEPEDEEEGFFDEIKRELDEMVEEARERDVPLVSLYSPVVIVGVPLVVALDKYVLGKDEYVRDLTTQIVHRDRCPKGSCHRDSSYRQFESEFRRLQSQCPTSSCHGDFGHEGFYRKLHPDPIFVPLEPIDPILVPQPPGPRPDPVPGPQPEPKPEPKPGPKPEPDRETIETEKKLALEIRNKILARVLRGRAETLPHLPDKVPYPYRMDDGIWRLNIILDDQALAPVRLDLARYRAEKDAYIRYLFDQIRKKVAELEKERAKEEPKKTDEPSEKDEPKEKDRPEEKDEPKKQDEGDKKTEDEDDCGIGCVAEKIYDTSKDVFETGKEAIEKADELLGFSDLLDLPEKIKALPEFIDLYDQMKLFWEFMRHLDEFEKWFKDPQALVRSLVGIESSALLDSLEAWVDQPEGKEAKVEKGREIYGLAMKVKRLLAKIKTLLRPIFGVRKAIKGLLGQIRALVEKVPSLEMVQYLISIASDPNELRDIGRQMVEDTIGEFLGDVTGAIKTKIHEIIASLKLPKLEFSADDFIDDEKIEKAVANVAARLVPGVAGKALRTRPGKYALSKVVGLFLEGTANQAFDAVSSRLGGFNKLLAAQLDGTLGAFEKKLFDFIQPKIREMIFPKPATDVSRSAADRQSSGSADRLRIVPLMLGGSKGEPLDEALLGRMEGAFQTDFSSVRIHRDRIAGRSAKMLRADAFTIGGDIYFGEGKYAPQDAAGQRLLAHELAHVQQHQRFNRRGRIQRSLIDELGDGVIGALRLIEFRVYPETGEIDPNTKRPKIDPRTKRPVRQTHRRQLRKRMTGPGWADTGRDWEAHHIIPWEFLFHSVFDILRANGGWDFNDPKNGIALPTREGIAGAEKLPVHQFRKRIIASHPVYSRKVEAELNNLLAKYDKDPARLRIEIDKLIDRLKANELVSSKMKTLM